MQLDKEAQRQEAIKCLEILEAQGLDKTVLKDFKKDGTLYYSERQLLQIGDNEPQPVGVLYWLSNNEDFLKIVRDFEEKHNAIVYHCTHEFFNFGEVLDLFYVSKYAEQWDMEQEELENGYSSVYAHNFTTPHYSECGQIPYKIVYGGMLRTA